MLYVEVKSRKWVNSVYHVGQQSIHDHHMAWDDTACLGYIISALENLDYKTDKIIEIVMELNELFDWQTVEEAHEYYKNSGYMD